MCVCVCVYVINGVIIVHIFMLTQQVVGKKNNKKNCFLIALVSRGMNIYFPNNVQCHIYVFIYFLRFLIWNYFIYN